MGRSPTKKVARSSAVDIVALVEAGAVVEVDDVVDVGAVLEVDSVVGGDAAGAGWVVSGVRAALRVAGVVVAVGAVSPSSPAHLVSVQIARSNRRPFTTTPPIRSCLSAEYFLVPIPHRKPA